MARQTLVVDASVGVKWFSAVSEAYVAQARALLLGHSREELHLLVPELFFHEVANVLVHKATISEERLLWAMTRLSSLNLELFPVNGERLLAAVQLARKATITEYDAYYVVTARENGCPLVTANPRHQGKALDCEVIPLDKWPKGAA